MPDALDILARTDTVLRAAQTIAGEAMGIDGTYALFLLQLKNQRLMCRKFAQSGMFLGSNTSYAIAKLHKLGLIDREDDPTDKRKNWVSLSVDGHALCKRVRPEIERRIGDLLERNKISAG